MAKGETVRPLDYLIAFTLGALLATLVTKARADELLIHGPSHHFDRDAGYNENNYGLGYRFDNNVVTGTYHNSESKQSVYVAYHLQLIGNLGLMAGAGSASNQS